VAAKQEDVVPSIDKTGGRNVVDVIDDPDHADRGRGVDRARRVLVVKRDIATGYWSFEECAGLPDSAYRFRELMVHLGLERVAEIEVVRDGTRECPGADQVPGGFGNRDLTAAVRIEIY